MLNVVIIGCGRISPYYYNAIQLSRNFNLVGVYDKSKNNSLSRVRLLSSVYVYLSYDDIINDPNIDCVIIALPNYLHFPFAIAALNAGKHVCVEKPTTTSFNEYLKLACAAKINNVTLYTAFHRSFNSIILDYKVPALTSIKHVSACFNEKPDLEASRWFFDKRKSGGGCIIDSAPNIYHALYKLFGELSIDKVKICSWIKDDIEIVAKVSGKFIFGATFDISIDWTKREDKQIVIFNEDSTIETLDFVSLFSPKFKNSMYHEYINVVCDFYTNILSGNFPKDQETIMKYIQETYEISGTKK